MARSVSSMWCAALILGVGTAGCSKKTSDTGSAPGALAPAGTSRGAPAWKATAPRRPTGRAVARGRSALEQLVWGFPKMQPAQILVRLQRLSPGDRSFLATFNQLSTALYLEACKANPRLIFPMGGARFHCARLRADLQQAFRFGTKPQSWRQEVQLQRQKIITSRRCARGELDRATCGRYYQALRRTGAMRHDTGQRIIENMGNKCRVGVDPGCRQ